MINLFSNSFTKAIIPSKSDPFIVRMEILNPGNTNASLEFLFPADFRLSLEGWAKNSNLTQEPIEH